MRTSSALLVAESSGISECLDRLAARKRLNRPVSTYRVQLNHRFRFEDARALVGYLHALGISHLYASPILQARAGSMHGYDITDHNRINPEIGSEEEFHALVRDLQAHGMGFVLDFVPNHMGVGHGTNPWWQDLLENGRTSEYASFFDIDWDPIKPELKGKVLIPVLGEQYGKELESGNIRLGFDNGRFFVRYYDIRLPLDPQTVPMIFAPLGDFHRRHTEWAGEQANRDITDIESVLAALRQLPSNHATDADLAQQRRRDAPPLLARFHAIYERSPRVRELVKEALDTINGQPGDARSFDPLHRLLEAQAYRLAHWRVSAEEINYRRFFDINDLVGLRMENPQVFAATHKLLRRLLTDGSITGIRVDHPDGLFNPRQYFTRVQMLYAAAHCCGPEPQPPVGDNGIETGVQEIFGAHDWMNQQAPLYVLIEKILEPGEQLPRAWPVDGTTGYDFTNQVNGIFLDRRNERAFTTLYHRFIGGAPEVDDLIYENKKLIMHTALSSEVTVLSHMLDEIAAADRSARDFTHKALLDAIRETIACFPVYRTYIDERGEISERDRAYIHEAVVRAKRRNEGTASAVFDFLREILLLREAGARSADGYRKRLYFTLKFQQLTGPVMAKGLEDTVCYVYNRFVSLNEVGGSPRNFGTTVDDFHRANQERQEAWPFGMLSTSTHDTKRSEDVRARLNVLSEMPRAWSSQVLRWRRANRSRKRVLGDGRNVPDLNEEYLLYQTLVGAWPLDLRTDKQRKRFLERIQAYMGKAVHEAKVNLSWINPNAEYTAALDEFISRLLTPGTRSRPNTFLEDMRHFLPAVNLFGAVNSLAQTVLKIASPGTPDVYQGTELWDFSLVDPDNRRPVDFALRQRYVNELLRREAGGDLLSLCAELLRSFHDGRVKMWLMLRAMRCRRENAELFQTGSYQPLFATGGKRDHVVAFARNHGRRLVIAAVPRLSYTLTSGRVHWPLGEVWGDTELPLPARSGGDFQNLFTGEVLRLTAARAVSCRELFAHFPVALLASG